MVRLATEARETAEVVFLHHIVSGCNLEEEAAQAPEELKKSVDKIFKAPRCLNRVGSNSRPVASLSLMSF